MKTLTVTATGRAAAAPDRITLTLTLQAQQQSYEAAMQLADEQLSQLQMAAAGCGFETKQLKTENFTVNPCYENRQTENGSYESVFSGYSVSHSLSLRFAMDTQLLAQVLAAVSSCGCDPRLGISFEVENTEALCAAALKDAAEAARFRAEVLAYASGAQLHELTEIRHGDDSRPVCFTNYGVSMLRAAPAAAVDLTPQDVEAEETVTFVWSLLE